MGVREELLLAGFDRFAPGKGITIKATKGLATFGEGLADDEVRYLHALVRRRLLRCVEPSARFGSPAQSPMR
jgi:hypothetical protein